MNKVVGEVTVTQEQILHGDHHIVTGLAIADETEAFAAGTVLYKGEDGYVPLTKTDSENKPVAVAIEGLEEEADSAVVPGCIHGAVRTEKLIYADGTKVSSETKDALREAGIYCIAD